MEESGCCGSGKEYSENSGCGCSCNGCSGHNEQWNHDEWDMQSMMMHLAKKAKFELIKEKMKKKLEMTEGKKLDEIADLVVETMLEKYKLKTELEEKQEELEDKWDEMERKLDEIFSREK